MKTAAGLTLVVVLLVTGCSTTHRVAVKEEPGICTFLGEACHELQPGAKGEAGLRWVNPKGDPTQYNKVIVEVAGFFGTDVSKVPPADQEKLTALFQESREILGIMPQQASPLPEGPCLDTNAER
jgi:hypothetical protein